MSATRAVGSNQNFQIFTCHACGIKPEQLKKCGRCFRAYYCSRECQSKDWPSHKRVCVQPPADFFYIDQRHTTGSDIEHDRGYRKHKSVCVRPPADLFCNHQRRITGSDIRLDRGYRRPMPQRLIVDQTKFDIDY